MKKKRKYVRKTIPAAAIEEKELSKKVEYPKWTNNFIINRLDYVDNLLSSVSEILADIRGRMDLE